MSSWESPDDVLAILGPSQAGLPPDQKRPPEQFVNSDGKRVAIYYFRSGWVSNGRLTDDEVTPYVFIDGQLSGVGWTAIGGPRSYGQVPPKPPRTTSTSPSSRQNDPVRGSHAVTSFVDSGAPDELPRRGVVGKGGTPPQAGAAPLSFARDGDRHRGQLNGRARSRCRRHRWRAASVGRLRRCRVVRRALRSRRRDPAWRPLSQLRGVPGRLRAAAGLAHARGDRRLLGDRGCAGRSGFSRLHAWAGRAEIVGRANITTANMYSER